MSYFIEGMKKTFNLKNIINEIVTLRKVTIWMMIVMLLAEVATFIVGGSYNFVAWLGLFTGFSTVLNLILIDQGRITNYFWGAVNCAVYLTIALENRLIGDIASQIFYFVFQFVGIYFWYKQLQKQDGDKEEVKSRRITPLVAILSVVGFVVLYTVILLTSQKLQGNQVYIDSLLLPLGVIGQILMTYGYASQWYVWIAINVINVYIWAVQLNHGGEAALTMLVVKIIMLINSLYGCYLWYREN